jgi:hypothetical protein
MENDLAATQPEQVTAAPVLEESAPLQTDSTPVEPVKEPNAEPDWFRKRIDEITAKRYAEQRDAEQRYQMTARERDQLRQQLEQRQQEPEQVKTLEDFGYDEGKYQEHLFQQAEARAEKAALRVRQQESDRVNAERTQRKFKEREVSFEKETPDYRDVAHFAPISDDVGQIIMQAENGPELAYHLGKNKDIALSLSDLPRDVAAFELGRIDAKLSAERATKKAALDAAKAAKAVTTAPPPAPKLDGSNAQVGKDPTQMTDKEFAKWRANQIAQRRA